MEQCVEEFSKFEDAVSDYIHTVDYRETPKETKRVTIREKPAIHKSVMIGPLVDRAGNISSHKVLVRRSVTR